MSVTWCSRQNRATERAAKSWKLVKPAALGGSVVEDAIKHDAEAKAQALDVVPGADLRVDLREADD